MRKDPLVRLLALTDKLDNGCWQYKGYLHNGYARIWDGSRTVRAHRFSYEMVNGKIPDRLVIDHLCRNKACVNPAHLEVVTIKENTLRGDGPTSLNSRKSHCQKGHEFTPDNTAFECGSRICKVCKSIKAKAYMAKNWPKYSERRRQQRLSR